MPAKEIYSSANEPCGNPWSRSNLMTRFVKKKGIFLGEDQVIREIYEQWMIEGHCIRCSAVVHFEFANVSLAMMIPSSSSLNGLTNRWATTKSLCLGGSVQV